MIMAQKMPVAMLLLRRSEGISHHPDENVFLGMSRRLRELACASSNGWRSRMVNKRNAAAEDCAAYTETSRCTISARLGVPCKLITSF